MESHDHVLMGLFRDLCRNKGGVGNGCQVWEAFEIFKSIEDFLALVVSSLIKAAYVDKRVSAFPGYSRVHRDRFEWAFVDAVAFHSLDFAVH